MTGLTINSSAGQAAALRSLSALDRNIATTESRLTTGLRIASPRDDGAAFSVSVGFRAEIKSTQAVRQGLDTGRGVVGVALAGATQIQATLDNLKKLVLDAAGTTDRQKLESLATQFQQGIATIDSIIKGSSFQGVNLLDGSRNSISFAAGVVSGNVSLAGFNFTTDIKTLLETNSIGNTLPPTNPPPTPGKYDQLVSDIVSKVKQTTGRTDETSIRDFANRFIDQLGRDNESRVREFGQRLLDSLGGTAPADERNRQLVGRIVDRIDRGANDDRTDGLIGRLIERLEDRAPPPQPQNQTFRVEFLSESAGYKNVFGYYNRETGEGGILFPNVEADGNNAPLEPGQSAAEFTVRAEDANKIEYFLISDGANLNSSSELSGRVRVTQAPDGSYRVARVDAQGNYIRDGQGNIDFLNGRDAPALFTETGKNAGGVDYASAVPGSSQTSSTLAGDRADGPTGIVAFEDIAAQRHGNNGSYGQPGDADYNDAVFNVTRVGSPPPPPPTTTLKATFQSEEAGYKNVFGYYNTRTGEAEILFGNVEADGANAPLRPGQSSAEFTVNTADVNNIGYFLISNGANLNSAAELEGSFKVVQAADGSFGIARADEEGNLLRDAQGNPEFLEGQGARALFTERSKNAGSVDYASGTPGANQNRRSLRSDTTDGPTGTVAFEDLAATRNGNHGSYGKPGDADYDDAVFNVTITGQTGGSGGTGGVGGGNGTGNNGNGNGNGGGTGGVGGGNGNGNNGNGNGNGGGTGGVGGGNGNGNNGNGNGGSTGGGTGGGGTGGTGGGGTGGGTGGTGGTGGGTGGTVTLSQVYASVEQAIQQVAIGTAALGAAAQQIEKYDNFLGDFSGVLEAGLSALVDADLEKESANLVAQKIQKELGTQAVGVTGKATSEAVQSLFREPLVEASLASEEGGSIQKSAILKVEPKNEEGASGLQKSAVIRPNAARDEDDGPALLGVSNLRRSAILQLASDEGGSGGTAAITLQRSPILRIAAGAASGARIDISA